MIRKGFSIILICLVIFKIQCQKPPEITDSYIARGEIIQSQLGMPNVIQAVFEETFDSTSQNAAFVVTIGGENTTFMSNFKTNQSFLYQYDKFEKKTKCAETTEKEWETQYPPGLISYEHDDGTLRFSLKQLFDIPVKYLDKAEESVIYRNIPAKKWVYQIPGKKTPEGYETTITISEYWSDGTWNTSSNEQNTPLGFHVNKITNKEGKKVPEEYITNIFGFVSGTYDRKYFEPIQGVFCANRKSTLKFPNVRELRAISLHSEMVLPSQQEIRYIDMWFDPMSQLIRTDLERMKDEDPMKERKEKRYQSEIAIGKMGVVFRQSYFKDEFQCEVKEFKEYENDYQNFIDVKQNLAKWKMDKLFGLNDTTYVYIGKTTKNDIPCHIFQGIRKDWPQASDNITSLWEWCFNINATNMNEIATFQSGELGLINAQVTILSTGKEGDPLVGFRMFHHFYSVKEQDPQILAATRFDISRCFNYSRKRGLQFYLDWDIESDNKHLAENATSDVNFLQRWKAVIYQYSGLPSYSLRVANVRSTIDDNKLYIKFFILSIHEKLPDSIKKSQKEASEAEQILRQNINNRKVSIMYKIKDKLTTLSVVPHSMTFQINPNVKLHTLPPPPSTTPSSPTKFPFSLRTEPDSGSENPVTSGKSNSPGGNTDEETKHQTTSITKPQTTSTPNRKKVIVRTGHQPGTVAAVSIAMLLAGMSIGSAGTFYKFSGLPSCMKS